MQVGAASFSMASVARTTSPGSRSARRLLLHRTKLIRFMEDEGRERDCQPERLPRVRRIRIAVADDPVSPSPRSRRRRSSSNARAGRSVSSSSAVIGEEGQSSATGSQPRVRGRAALGHPADVGRTVVLVEAPEYGPSTIATRYHATSSTSCGAPMTKTRAPSSSVPRTSAPPPGSRRRLRPATATSATARLVSAAGGWRLGRYRRRAWIRSRRARRLAAWIGIGGGRWRWRRRFTCDWFRSRPQQDERQEHAQHRDERSPTDRGHHDTSPHARPPDCGGAPRALRTADRTPRRVAGWRRSWRTSHPCRRAYARPTTDGLRRVVGEIRTFATNVR